MVRRASTTLVAALLLQCGLARAIHADDYEARTLMLDWWCPLADPDTDDDSRWYL